MNFYLYYFIQFFLIKNYICLHKIIKVIIYIPILGLILSVFLIFNNFYSNKNSMFLFGVLVFVLLNALQNILFIHDTNRFWIAILYGHTIPLYFLVGPFLFFYTRNGITNTTKPLKSDYLHFLPFAIGLISILPYYFTDFDTKLRTAQLIIENPEYLAKINVSWLYNSITNTLVRGPIYFIYSTYNLYFLFRFSSNYKNKALFNYQEKTFVKWLIMINCIVMLLSVFYSIFTIRSFSNPNLLVLEKTNLSIVSITLNLIWLSIPIVILAFPQILYGFHKFKKQYKPNKVFRKVGHEPSEMMTSLILEVVKKEENLLNPDFNVDDICKILHIDKYEVLYFFNITLNKKFITLRKELRVELAKKEICSGKLLSQSMEGVWMKSGFTSKTSFFTAFKEVTGMTPLQFSKSLKKKS
jgi:AraC-like DNA-binding protein